jgi:DNA-binding CsgD family transcriptional regulator
VVDRALGDLAQTQDRRFRTELVLIALRNEADRPVGPGTREESSRRLDRLAAELETLAVDGDDDVDHAAHHRTACQELSRARDRATADGWLGAAALWREAARPREEAYCLFRAAECHTVAKERKEAARSAEQARVIAERLGAGPLLAEIHGLISRTRLAPPVPRAAVDDRPYGLTDREWEVLALVGTGATNRQIGRKLFISERTVGVHVSRILHKLQVTNRAQAAALAAKVAR